MAEYVTNSDINLALHDYIVDSVIPKMRERRGRNADLTASQIHERINRDRVSGKPGEEVEFRMEIGRLADGIDGQFASEIADLVYYTSMKNCPEVDKHMMHTWFEFLGIPFTEAQEFCIIKYETRIMRGDEPDHKQIENEKLDRYIDKYYPYLKTIWQNPS